MSVSVYFLIASHLLVFHLCKHGEKRVRDSRFWVNGRITSTHLDFDFLAKWITHSVCSLFCAVNVCARVIHICSSLAHSMTIWHQITPHVSYINEQFNEHFIILLTKHNLHSNSNIMHPYAAPFFIHYGDGRICTNRQMNVQMKIETIFHLWCKRML